MLRYRIGPVIAGQKKYYTNPEDADRPFSERRPMTRKDGSTVEFVEFTVPGESAPRSMTLGAGVEPPAEGEVVLIGVEDFVSERAEIAKSGKPYIQRRPKARAISFEPAKLAA